MIPSTIHYCWFGHNPKPKIAEKCINSWNKYCPEYNIIEWNEDNFDIQTAPPYVQQAYAAKKWAFVSDYVRLKVVHDYGGIYLDTDVELVKSLDELVQYPAYFGFERGEYINTGLGFGAEQNSPILKDLMCDYENIPFVLEDGSYDLTACPIRNTPVFVKKGLRCDNSRQVLGDGTLILPSEYLCPIDTATKRLRRTKNTISIHHFDASWQSRSTRKAHDKLARKRRIRQNIDCYLSVPKVVLRKIMGDRLYEMLKSQIKGRIIG